MNKNHLLPALLFVLAACGGTTSSSAPASSAALDPNEYRLVGGQTNLGDWTPADAPVMSRTTGTNSYSITVDIYELTGFKIVVGGAWENGEIGPRSSGITISIDGVSWTKDNDGMIIVPESSKIGAAGELGTGDFISREDGNYTITLVSLPVVSKTLSIVRNSGPLVPPPVETYELPEWRVFKNDWEGSAASHEAVDGELVMTVENGNFSADPAFNWKLQIIQDGHVPTLGGPDNSGYMQLESGKTYKVSFDARASVAGKFTLAIGHPAGGFTSYHTNALLEVTTTMQKLTSEFTLPADGDFSVLAQFKLEMGNLFAGAAIGSTFVLDNVLIEEKVGDNFVATELILNGAMDKIDYFTSYSFVGAATLAGWNNGADGFELTYNPDNGEYTFEDLVLTEGLFRVTVTGTWGGNIGFSKLSPSVTGFTAGENDDNILVGVDGVGTYDVLLVFVEEVAELTFTKVS
jgi:hypothetical protein